MIATALSLYLAILACATAPSPTAHEVGLYFRAEQGYTWECDKAYKD